MKINIFKIGSVSIILISVFNILEVYKKPATNQAYYKTCGNTCRQLTGGSGFPFESFGSLQATINTDAGTSTPLYINNSCTQPAYFSN